MSQLVALSYLDEHRAPEVLATVQRLHTGSLLQPQDVVCVTSGADRVMTLHYAADLRTDEVRTYRFWRALLIRLLLAPELEWAGVEVKVDPSFAGRIAAALAPGASALLLLVPAAALPRLLAELDRFGGLLLESSVDRAGIERLSDVEPGSRGSAGADAMHWGRSLMAPRTGAAPHGPGLIALAYADEFRAAEVLAMLGRLQTGRLVEPQNRASVARAADAALTLHYAADLRADEDPMHRFWRTLVTSIVLAPGGIARMITPSALGLDGQFVRELEAVLPLGGSAILLLVPRRTLPRVLPELQRFGGTLLQTTVPRAIVAQLQRLPEARSGSDRIRRRSPRGRLFPGEPTRARRPTRQSGRG